MKRAIPIKMKRHSDARKASLNYSDSEMHETDNFCKFIQKKQACNMLPFLSLFGIFLSVILLFFNAKKYSSSIYLGLFFLFISLYGFYQYILLYSKSVALISFFQLSLSIICSPIYLIGPMLFFYVRSVLTDCPKLRKNDLWHFLPMIIFFISALPNTFIPWQEKVEVAQKVASDKEFLMVYKATLIGEIIPAVTLYLFRLFLVLGYSIGSIILFMSYLKKSNLTKVFSSQHFMIQWMFCLLGFTFILVTSQIFLVTKSFEMHFSDLFFTFNIIRVISVTGLLGLLISPFFFPAILYGLPQLPESGAKYTNHKQSTKSSPDQITGNKISFETNYLDHIQRKIEDVMREQHPYLQTDFTLAELSVMSKVPIHHLAYLFREVKNERFIDYRNKWRIYHAKNLIEEGKTADLTLEAIGLQSGFTNRNAFRNAFKRIEGNSPNDFLSQLKN